MDPPQFSLDNMLEDVSDTEPEPVPRRKGQQEEKPPSPWESMHARPCDPSKPLDELEVRLVKAFKKNHVINAPEATKRMDVIKSGSICKKCLLFKSICQVIGRHVEERESQGK